MTPVSPGGEARTRREALRLLLAEHSYTLSELAAALEMKLNEVDGHLRHLAKSARNEPWRVVVQPARCRQCGFRFGEERFKKPGKCPRCRSRHIEAPRIGIEGG